MCAARASFPAGYVVGFVGLVCDHDLAGMSAGILSIRSSGEVAAFSKPAGMPCSRSLCCSVQGSLNGSFVLTLDKALCRGFVIGDAETWKDEERPVL